MDPHLESSESSRCGWFDTEAGCLKLCNESSDALPSSETPSTNDFFLGSLVVDSLRVPVIDLRYISILTQGKEGSKFLVWIVFFSVCPNCL
jgi:hypothetical protein